MRNTFLMVLITIAALFFSKATLAQQPAAKPLQQFATPLDKMVLEDGDTIVFLGDSITHQCLYTQYFENYIYTRYPKKRIRMHNAGVSGAKAWDALQRFDKDVAAYKPKYVTVLLGMNDGRYEPFNQEHFLTYQNDMAKVIEKIKAINAIPILMTPTMFDARARRMRLRNSDEATVSQYNSVMAYYGAWMREVAVHSGYGYVDMFGPLNQLTVEQRKLDSKFTMIKDAIHPDPPGQVVMATAMVSDLNLPRQISYIRLNNTKGNGFRAAAVGGKVTDLKENAEGLEFTWHADSLPWILPENADSGVVMTKMGHKLTREGIQINNLKPGYYRLAIDDQPIAIFHSITLERHIELQSQKLTPQYQQAAKVAQLNAKRNAGPIRKLRGEWSRFQRYARLREIVEQAPHIDQKMVDQVAAYEKQLIGIDERIKQINTEAKELEDQIFEINQPQPRRFKFTKVEAPVKKKPAGKQKQKVPAAK